MKSSKAHKSARQESVQAAPNAIVLAPGELWCARCGETMFSGNICPRCEGQIWVDPKRVLHPGEFIEGASGT